MKIKKIRPIKLERLALPDNMEYTLAYAINNGYKNEDSRGKSYETGSIYLLNLNGSSKKDDIRIAKRNNTVNALCFIPEYGLFDAGDYHRRIIVRDGGPGAWGDLDTIVRRYEDSELRKLIDIEGNIVDRKIQGRNRKTPSISSLLYVPRIGLLGRISGCTGLSLFLDEKGDFVVDTFLCDTGFENECEEYVPGAGIFSGGSSLQHTVDINGKLISRILLDTCPSVHSLCFHPSLGLISSSDGGVNLETDQEGNQLKKRKNLNIRNYLLDVGYVNSEDHANFKYIPGIGLIRYTNLSCGYFNTYEDSIELVINKDGMVVVCDYRSFDPYVTKIRKGLGKVTAIAPVPKHFFEAAKKQLKI